jgi:hypothetical protein
MSREEKEKVLKDWQRFVTADFSKARFTKRLYSHLIQHCSFITHFSQGAFYEMYFEDPEDTLRFMKQFDKDQGCVSVEYGMTYCIKNDDYGDINTAMVESMELYKSGLNPRLNQNAKERKLAEIEKLKKECEQL